jgi:transposase InsO family protein
MRMVSEKAKERTRVLAFWERHGLEATMEAFQVSRRTIFRWREKLKEGGGKFESLNEQSRQPKHLRKREWPEGIKTEIKRLRNEHPNLGKEKIKKLLERFCDTKDMGGLRIFPTKVHHNGQIVPRKRASRPRKPKDFRAEYPGHCGAFDTIEKIIHGSRRYVLTFTDIYSRFSVAWATTSHASMAAKEFFDVVRFLFPFELKYILTDNGSEFMKHFDDQIRELHKEHWHTYPKTPKMNAHAERFNRTIQEEYLDYHEGELLNPDHFNIGLMKHLLWHNTERPHHSINLQSPAEYIKKFQGQSLNTFPQQECQMYLTYTIYCHFCCFALEYG